MNQILKRLSTLCLCLFVLSANATRARAQDTWSLMTADLRSGPAALKAIDQAGVHVEMDGDKRIIPMDQFVEMSRPLPAVPLAGHFALHLIGGDRIGGEPIAVKGEQLVWKNPTVGELQVPMRLLAGLTRPDAAISDAQRKDDLALLANGDSIHGSIADLTTTKVTLQTDAGPTDIPLESITSIAFATATSVGRDKVGVRVRLDDGSSLLGASVTTDGAMIQFNLGVGSPRPIELAHVVAIEQVNGPVSWLSSRATSQSVYSSYLGDGQDYPARMNANYRGLPIFFKDHRYSRGIGVHSYSRLTFPLDGKTYTAFRTRYAIDPDARQGVADVTVRIKLDDKVLSERQHFQAGELSPPIVLDLNNARTLTLEVDFGANLDAEDRLNWIEPALLKVRPAPEFNQSTTPGEATPATKPSTTGSAS